MNYCQFRNDFIKRMASSVKPILPPEYQQVEYLENVSSQYINTGVLIDATIGVDIDFETVALNSWNSIFGSDIQDGSSRFFIGYGSYIKSWYRCAGPQINFTNNYAQSNIKTKLYYNNGTLEISNSNGTYSDTYTNTATASIYPIYLFGLNRRGNLVDVSYLKIFSAIIYKNNQIKFDGYPCFRKSDNKPGMYDLVTNTFFTNAGTGEFTVGNPV